MSNKSKRNIHSDPDIEPQNPEVKRPKLLEGTLSQAYRNRRSSTATTESLSSIERGGLPPREQEAEYGDTEHTGRSNLGPHGEQATTKSNELKEAQDAEAESEAYRAETDSNNWQPIIVEIENKYYLWLKETENLCSLHPLVSELFVQSGNVSFKVGSMAEVVVTQNEVLRFTYMRILDTLDSATIRLNMPIHLGESFIQHYMGEGISITPGCQSSYMEMQPHAQHFKEFCTELVCCSDLASSNETVKTAVESLRKGTVSEQHCLETLLACCRFGLRDSLWYRRLEDTIKHE